MLDIIAVPFGYIIRFLNSFTDNYALALLLFACIVKIVLLPFDYKRKKSEQKMQLLQPDINKINSRYQDLPEAEAKQKRQQDLAQLYVDKKASPASGCVSFLLQFPILIAIYRVVTTPLIYLCRFSSDTISQVLQHAEKINGAPVTQMQALSIAKTHFFSFQDIPAFNATYTSASQLPRMTVFGLDVSGTPSLVNINYLVLIPVLAFVIMFGISFIQQWRNGTFKTSKKYVFLATSLLGPLTTVWLAFQVPAMVALYWIYQNILSVLCNIALKYIVKAPKIDTEQNNNIEALDSQSVVTEDEQGTDTTNMPGASPLPTSQQETQVV